MDKRENKPVYRVSGVLFSVFVLLLGVYWLVGVLSSMDLEVFGVMYYLGGALFPALFMLLGGYGVNYYYKKY
jgi:hypothetical protein